MGLAGPITHVAGGDDRVALAPPFKMQGQCWVASLARLPKADALAAIADNENWPRRSTVQLLEDGRKLGPPHTAHARIRENGKGAFSHWKDSLYFSTSDGSDPNQNGRAYELVISVEDNRQSGTMPVVDAATAFINNSKTFEASLAAARACVQRRQWSGAIEILERLPAFPGHAAEAKSILARAYFEAGRLQDADRAFSDLVILHAEDSQFWLALGRVRKRLKDWPRARDAWRRVVELRPDDIDMRWELAAACWEGGFHDEARPEVDWILARNADHRGALTVLARALFDAEPERSLACWSRLAAAAPQAFEPHLQVARLHLRARRCSEAEKAFRTVLALVPEHAEALAKVALLVGSRDEKEAVGLLSRWSAAAPTDAAPWIALGELHAALLTQLAQLEGQFDFFGSSGNRVGDLGRS